MPYTLRRKVSFPARKKIIKKLVKKIETEVIIQEILSKQNVSPKELNAVIELVKKEMLPILLEISMPSMKKKCLDTTLDILSKIEPWQLQTYEGMPITFAILIKNDDITSGELSMLDYPFVKTLSDGVTGTFELNGNGELGYVVLKGYANAKTYSPLRFAAISEKTAEDQGVAIVLTRQREILIVTNGALSIVKRRGKWLPVNYEKYKEFMNKSLKNKISDDVLEAIYLSILDVSFSRTGGCIGVVTLSKDPLIEENSYSGWKKKMIEKIIDANPFHTIEREARAKLLGIDGATIIRRDGSVSSSGSIVPINGESGNFQKFFKDNDTGGRSTAAKNLAQAGIGIKISNDGNVKIYNKHIRLNEHEIKNAFEFL